MTYVNITRGIFSFQFHEALALNLDYCKRNQRKDWDFKQLISGDGMTRTGKSTLAFQLACYQDEGFIDNWKEQVVFNGADLIKVAYKIGIGKVIVYDEAREGLDSKRQMESYTKNLLDFFSQCGNLNHILIIVLPEFFDLPRSIAITQSIFLINCYARDGFERGYFDFFNRKDKKYLFINGQKYLDYKAQTPSFKGTFINFIPFDRVEYETLKKVSLLKTKERKEQSDRTTDFYLKIIRNTITSLMLKGFEKTHISEIMGVSRKTIYNLINLMKELQIDDKEDTQEDEEQSLPKEDSKVCMGNVNDIDVYNGNEYVDKQKLEEEKPINNKHLNKLTKNIKQNAIYITKELK